MKHWLSIIMAGILTGAVLLGCGSSSGASGSTPSTAVSAGATSEAGTAGTEAGSAGTGTGAGSAEAVGTAAVQTEPAGASGSGRKVLVLYYSASGNTKRIADMIASDTGADEYEITPSDPYTDDDLDWTKDGSRVNQEHENEALQDVAFDSYDVPDWDSYDTVFVGYPIWWQDASWVMKSYVKHLDFSGKTVIPFCTSSSSGLGNSGKNLESIAGSGTWLEGQRFSGGASSDDVQSWVSSLDL